MNLKNKFFLKQFNFFRNTALKIIVLMLFIFPGKSSVKAQQKQIDSLLNVLKNYPKEDTIKANILYQISEECDEKDMMTYAGASLALSEKLKYDKGIANASVNVGYVLNKNGKLDSAIVCYQRGLSIYEKIGDKNGKSTAINNIAFIYQSRGDIKKAEEYYKKSLTIAEEAGSRQEAVHALNNLGYLYNILGDNVTALSYYNKSLKIREELGDKKEISLALNNVGSTYKDAEANSMALEYYLKSLKMAEAADDKPDASIAYNNIGQVYEEQGEYSKSLEYHKKSLSLCEESGDKGGMAYSYGNMGSVNIKLGKIQNAIELFSKSLSIRKEIEDIDGMGQSLNNLGHAYALSGDYAKAMEYFNESLVFHKKMGNKRSMSIALNNIAKVYFKQKKYREAENYGFRSVTLAKEVRNPLELSMATSSLSDIYAKQGKYENAYKMHVLFKQMSDSILKNKTRDATVKGLMQHEFDKKEMQLKSEQEKKDVIAKIENLKQKAEIEKQKTARNIAIGSVIVFLALGLSGFLIYHTNRLRKEDLLKRQALESIMTALCARMNPHFIFNSLNSIKYYMHISQMKDAETYLIKFADLMRKILENSQHQEISLADEIEALQLYMSLEKIRMQHPFTEKLEYGTVDVTNITIPPLILQPFVENAILHGLMGKEDYGNIEIAFSQQDDMLVCSITDDGIGRENSRKNKKGASKKDSFGLKLTEQRIRILNELNKVKAHFKVEDLYDVENKPSGTKVELSLPLSI